MKVQVVECSMFGLNVRYLPDGRRSVQESFTMQSVGGLLSASVLVNVLDGWDWRFNLLSHPHNILQSLPITLPTAVPGSDAAHEDPRNIGRIKSSEDGRGCLQVVEVHLLIFSQVCGVEILVLYAIWNFVLLTLRDRLLSLHNPPAVSPAPFHNKTFTAFAILTILLRAANFSK